MFGHSSTKPAADTAQDDGPTFPLFLLPSFSFPFRRHRRRTSFQSDQDRPSSDATTESEYYDSLSSVPSLSSSPESSADAGSPATPKSFKSFFPELPSLNRLRGFAGKSETHTPDPPPATRSRLARIQPDTLRCNLCSTDIAFCSQIVSKGFTGRHGRAYLVSPPSSQGSPSCPASPLNKTDNPENTKVGNNTDLVNVRVGPPESRQLVTGQHVVADISCVVCGSKLGWKYVDAREHAQKYKVGRFILETQRVVASHTWEDVDDTPSAPAPTLSRPDEASNDGPNTTAQALHPTYGQYHSERDMNERNSQANIRQSSPSPSQSPSSSSSSTSTRDSSLEVAEEEIVFDSGDEDECDDIFAGVWDAQVVAKRRRHKVANIRRNGASSIPAGYY